MIPSSWPRSQQEATHAQATARCDALELLTVVVVVAILASLAVPSYRRYLIRAQRSDATTALLRMAASQEKHVPQYGVYVTATASFRTRTPRADSACRRSPSAVTTT